MKLVIPDISIQLIAIAILWSLIALLLGVNSSYSQEHLRFDQLSFKEGLGGDWYFHITEDSSGFIWMASHTGLSRFDGKSAKHYSHYTDDSLSLGENQVFRLFINGPDEIWCSTLGGGLSILNPKTGEFRNLNPLNGNWPVARTGQVIRKSDSLYYFISGGDQNSLWELSIVKDSLQFREFPIEGTSENLYFRDNKVRYLLEDPTNPDFLWIIGNFRVYRFDVHLDKLEIFYEFDFLLEHGIQFDLIPAAEWMDEHHLLLSIQYFGITKFSVRDGSYKILYQDEDKLPFHVRSIHKKRDGNFLMAYSDGSLLEFDPEKNEFNAVSIQYPYNLTPNFEYIFEARNGDIYLATNGAGVFRLKKDFHRISTLGIINDLKPNYGNLFQRSFFLPDSDIILFSNFRVDSLFLLNAKDEEINIVQNSSIPGIFRGNFSSDKNDLILTHNGRRIYRFSLDDYSLHRYPLDGIDTLYNQKRHIKTIEFDESGRLWIMGNNFIRVYKGENLVNEYLLTFEDGYTLENYRNFLLLDRKILFIDWDQQFLLYDLDLQYIYKLEDNRDQFGFSSFVFRTPIQIDSKIYMACSYTGFWEAKIAYDSIAFQKVHRAPECLLSNNVYYLTKQNDFLWIKTGLGLQRFDPKNQQFINFDYRHALPQLYMDRQMDIRDDGNFSLALNNYLYYGNLNDIIPQRVDAKAYLTGLKIDNKELIKGWLTADELPIHLNYLNKIFEFEWSILNASPAYTYQLYYLLEGFDTEWRNLTPNDDFRAIYTNLSPGEYNFKLKCVPLIDQDAFEVLNIPMIINPPFWKTWWFRLISLSLILGLVYSIYHWRIQTIRKEENIKREFNDKITELELSQLRSQMNPHFMFNCLNSIKLYILKNEKELAADYLSSFAQLVRDILNYSALDYIPLWDEIKTLKTYIELEKMRFSKEFNFELDIDPNIDLMNTSVPPMLLQPFVENAIWHGLMHKEGERKLKIDFYLENSSLIAEISDNGIGRTQAAKIRSKSAAKKSYGISISQSRLNQFRKKYALEIIDLKTEFGMPAGTKVVIELPYKTMD